MHKTKGTYCKLCKDFNFNFDAFVGFILLIVC